VKKQNHAAELSVLLIEDNPADVFLVKEALRTHAVKFDMNWISDGEQALRAIDHFTPAAPPDIVVLDLNLPKVDGKELLARIRQNSIFNKTPVVILTSSDSPADRVEAAALGATCYIQKPPTLNEFLALGGAIKEVAAGGHPDVCL
jgi:DNA-binding response OmpR family regulator